MASRRWPTKLVMSWEAVGDVQLCTCRNQVELLNTLSCFAALLSQSGINFEIYMHQNLPQIFAETISPTATWLFYSSNNLGWFACFRIQFLPDHIMIHSCLV